MAKATKSKVTKVDPVDLEIIEENDVFTLALDDEPILTERGHKVCHSNRRLIEHIISEFESEGYITIKDQVIIKPKKFNAYALFAIQKAYVESGADNLTENFPYELQQDPILYRSAGPEQVDQMARYGFVLDFLQSHKLSLPSLIFPYDAESLGENEEDTSSLTAPPPDFTEAIYHEFKELPAHRKVVTVFLHNIHSNVLLLPMMLATGKCSANEYASAVMAATVTHAATFGTSAKSHQTLFSGLAEDARVALEYIGYFEEGELKELREHLHGGESKIREFKPFLRGSIRDKQNEIEMTHKCLKTIAAFLNTDGGTLLIGVSDDGKKIIGIEKDGFPNDDEFLLHLNNVVKQSLGLLAASLVDKKIVRFSEGKTVCIVECERSPKPVYVSRKNEQNKNEQKFFIRRGPATDEVPPMDQYEYIKRHFKE